MRKFSLPQMIISQLVIAGLVICAMPWKTEASEAVETVAAKTAQKESVTDAQIATWIKALDSNDPNARQQAATKLQAGGISAVEALTKAGNTKNPELSTQCVEILKTMYESKNAESKELATAGLKELQKSDIKQVVQRAKQVTQKANPAPINRFGNVAFRIQVLQAAKKAAQKQNQVKNANNPKELKNVVKEGNKTIEIRETPDKEIIVKITEKIDGKDKVTETKAKNIIELRKKNKEAYEMYRKHKPKEPKQARMGMNPFGGNIQIAMAGGNGNMTMKQTNNNGQRHTEVTKNGRKIEIDDLNNTDIVVKITETVKGKKETKEYKAKDLKELKKKHPKAAKEYEEYNKGGGAMQIRVFGGAGNLPPNFPVLPPNLPKAQQKKFEEAVKRMQKMVEDARKEANKAP